MSCTDVHELAGEAALGLVTGAERAALLAHLDTCDDCRELVHELSTVADELVVLSPEAEPPSGFEQRVVQRLRVDRPRRWPVAVGAVAASLLLVLGFAIGRTGGHGSSAVRELTMRTPSGREVGEAYLHDGTPSWVFVTVPGWTDGTDTYELRVERQDGVTTDVDGGGSWGVVLPVDAAQVRTLSLVGSDGKVWCSTTV